MDQERLLRKMIGKIFRFLKDDNRRMEELLNQIRIIIKQKNWTQLVNLSQKEDIATAIANLWIKVKEKEYSNTTENNNSTTAEKKDSITAKNLKFALKWGCANLARDQIEKMSSYELSLLLPNGAAHVDYKKAFEFLKMMKSSQDNYNTYLYPWIIAEKTVPDGHNRIHCDTDVFHHLFVLCVLSQRFEMAMKIWERSSHQIATALVGKKLVDSIIAQINFKRDTSELQEMSGKFQDKAVELLETCYQNRLSLTSILITTPIPAWGGNNCLRLAASSEATTFIAHVCCQHWLENEWVGNTTAKIKGRQLQPQISSLEIALLIWQSTIFIEFSLKFLGSNKLRSKPQKKIKRLYKLETINILLFWLCLLRFFSSLFEVARIFYCFNFAVYTTKEIGFFLLLLVIFMISYSVANFGILQASQTPQQTIYSLFAVPYWNMFGELDIDRITGMDQGCFLSNRTIGIDGKPCPRNIWLALLMLAIYMIITNVLLLNLLIAVFNNIFTEVDQNSKELWKYHRYEMILKYKRKSPFPSPFSIIGILINCCRGKLGAVDQEGPSTAKQREHKLFLKFEVNCYRQMLRKNLVASELGTTKENEKSSYADEIDAQVDVSDSENSSERQATNRADNNSKTSITCV
ncbi:uncharacterized protein TRIADDRAFT_57357 [Trichoplax adhaerens]|uniref:TRPM-like domain-containing protein n=1 Tax=Trichoplax adhaerens TaxID=10228 RepID=B3RZ79_TRIAD|nr:hypothetical protein TRIADDRAFT_57357 [Trichoplax adhaerens]EDV23797.1 hypothetical protein TRIADDRAFT_57357 [Trichoplax adhaerens]|eukprot:XP_002113323.1 hypothetical protein TRIADDRAFT_57357 [Trichoplax adhaerens]